MQRILIQKTAHALVLVLQSVLLLPKVDLKQLSSRVLVEIVFPIGSLNYNRSFFELEILRSIDECSEKSLSFLESPHIVAIIFGSSIAFYIANHHFD